MAKRVLSFTMTVKSTLLGLPSRHLRCRLAAALAALESGQYMLCLATSPRSTGTVVPGVDVVVSRMLIGLQSVYVAPSGKQATSPFGLYQLQSRILLTSLGLGNLGFMDWVLGAWLIRRTSCVGIE